MARKVVRKTKAKKTSASRRTGARRPKRVFKRVLATRRDRTAALREGLEAAAPPPVPQAKIDPAGGAVSVEIMFGHAQHGTYAIQLFDPTGMQQIAVETGVNTDGVPDRFTLQLSAASLGQHLLQWSGAVDAFSPAPGQRFSVIFRVLQRAAVVPGGDVEKAGPLNITQAFLGILRLATS